MGHLGWLLSFWTSFVVYFILCKVWPTGNQRLIKEMEIGWEWMAGEELRGEDGTAARKESAAVLVRAV
jgi:NCS1 family nucleobase:cation symporter-1